MIKINKKPGNWDKKIIIATSQIAKIIISSISATLCYPEMNLAHSNFATFSHSKRIQGLKVAYYLPYL